MAYPDTGNVLLHLGWWDRCNDLSILIRADDLTLNMEDAEEGWSFGLALVGALGGEGDLEANHHWYNGSWMGVEYRLTFRFESNDECDRTSQLFAQLSHGWHDTIGAPYHFSPTSLASKLGFDKNDAKVVEVRNDDNDVGAEAVVHVDGWELLVRESRALESVIRVGRVSR